MYNDADITCCHDWVGTSFVHTGDIIKTSYNSLCCSSYKVLYNRTSLSVVLPAIDDLGGAPPATQHPGCTRM